MFWGLYLLTAAVGFACGHAVFLKKTAIPAAGLLGGGAWSILALQARNIVVYGNDTASSVTVGSEALQYLWAGVAIMHIAAAALWYWGVYPPDDDAAQAAGDIATETDTGAQARQQRMTEQP
jgi:hypothetical protein